MVEKVYLLWMQKRFKDYGGYNPTSYNTPQVMGVFLSAEDANSALNVTKSKKYSHPSEGVSYKFVIEERRIGEIHGSQGIYRTDW